jgi:hypothetical protein
MARQPRRRLFVDRKLQGALVLRALTYWVWCFVGMTLMLLCWRIVTGPARIFYMHFDEMWFLYAPAVIAGVLLLPFILYDTVRITNRFVGPILRLRRSMRQLAQGERVEPIKFRKGDFWPEFADEFNAVLARVQGDARPDASDVKPTSVTKEPPAVAAAASPR